MSLTLAQVEAVLRATGWQPYAEHQAELEESGCGDPALYADMANMWIDSHWDYVVKLDPAGVDPQGPADGPVVGSFEMFMDGEDDAIEDGDFVRLVALLEADEE